MGKAEDFFAARNLPKQQDAQKEFETKRANLFARIERELFGFVDQAERAQYKGAIVVSSTGPSPLFTRSRAAQVERTVTYGWRLTEYDPDTARGAESHITASTGDLYINNFLFNDPAKRNMCAQRPESLYDLDDVLLALQRLRRTLS